MFKIEDETIHITRGDIATISIAAKNGNKKYTFSQGDLLRFKVTEKNKCDSVKIVKDVLVAEETTEVDISLTQEDTKIGDIINRPTEYWYEVELNPDTNPQTIIGYDEEGAKIFVLYPEGADANV
jgi:pyridoxine 5'-phosphate synthase PdxJ